MHISCQYCTHAVECTTPSLSIVQDGMWHLEPLCVVGTRRPRNAGAQIWKCKWDPGYRFRVIYYRYRDYMINILLLTNIHDYFLSHFW